MRPKFLLPGDYVTPSIEYQDTNRKVKPGHTYKVTSIQLAIDGFFTFNIKSLDTNQYIQSCTFIGCKRLGGKNWNKINRYE
jgi:hypothetical protein